MNPISNFHHGQETSTPQWGASYDQPPTWRDHANCIGADTGPVFYDDTPAYTTARELCAACPVRHYCLEDALDDPFAIHGFRGGKTAQERRDLRRRRRLRLVDRRRK